MNRHISLADSVRGLQNHIQEIGGNYDTDINRPLKKVPFLLDPVAILKIKQLLTKYSLREFLLCNNIVCKAKC